MEQRKRTLTELLADDEPGNRHTITVRTSTPTPEPLTIDRLAEIIIKKRWVGRKFKAKDFEMYFVPQQAGSYVLPYGGKIYTMLKRMPGVAMLRVGTFTTTAAFLKTYTDNG